ncbi:hypothetical protein [Nonomuraea roseoviolacea]|uniref:ABC transporter permease n=1 Tax=Nonomuraea roseoviolacea subsp. carminata TaxID=160689 RepID=A0ABT1KBK2_9ACTN|nr:hypothetical protein [Nonomuraea roseoviolacea]MCP2351380.1 hypothetical protein [Nonomuraea roseoviolacea subsp. carminata]
MFVFELRRALRSPLLWGAAVLCLVLRLVAVWEWLPDLTIDPVSMSGAMLLLAAAGLLSAHLAVARDRRRSVPEALAALPGRAASRTSAAVAAVVAAGTGIAALVMALYLVIRAFMGPVAGRLDPFEAVAGVLAVPFAAALGAVLARWVRWAVAAPLAVFVVGAFTYLDGNQSGYGGWFLPVVLFHGPDWPGRPSGLHVVYLVAAVALMGALALLRHGPRPARVVAAVAAAAVAVPAGAVATARAPGAEVNALRFAAAARPERLPAWVRDHYLAPGSRRCERRGLLTYCAFPGYEPWIPLWAAAAGPVAEALPPWRRDRLPVVRQWAESWATYEDDDAPSVRAFMVWGRGGTGEDHRALLAAGLIDLVTGLRRGNTSGGEGCDARGQARTVVALWLLGQVVPPALPQDRLVQIGGSSYAAGPFPLGVGYGSAEVGYARRLLASPGARARVWAHWDTLMDPRTGIEQALPLLGLRPEATPAPKRPETAAGPVRGRPCG